MRIRSLQIKDYKRFHDLTIQTIPGSAKLMMLAGPNGYGKSSVFDAMLTWHRSRAQLGRNLEALYYMREPKDHQQVDLSGNVTIEFYEDLPQGLDDIKRMFYVRSAYRNDPDFQVAAIGRQNRDIDNVRFQRMIDNDVAVSANYTALMGKVLEIVTKQRNLTGNEILGKIFTEVNESLEKLFDGQLRLTDLGNPTLSGSFYFTKGVVSNFHYKNLSGGEKASFDLILDLIIRRTTFTNTVYCIDEPEVHLNTRVQGILLRELLRLIPTNCQLWIASHAIGMMRAARDIWLEDRDSVCFLDFEGRNLDKIEILEPVKPIRGFWERTLKVALDDLSSLVVPEHLVICEGTPRAYSSTKSHGNFDHDSKCYNMIFGETHPQTLFISGGGCTEVIRDHYILESGLMAAAKGIKVTRLIDRDSRTENEVKELKQKGIHVLSQRHLENYLWGDEILTALCEQVNHPQEIINVIEEKKDAMSRLAERGLPSDDAKSAANEVFAKVVKRLSLHNHGNTAREFMRNTLAPLVVPGTSTYASLKHDIFGDHKIQGAAQTSN